MKKFSIIIPAYNCEKYIEECLNSILNQSYINYEIIVVNDGSTDKTDEILKKYKNKNIKYIYQENSGAPAARNKGIDVSNGEYLIFLDADDKLADNILKTIDEKIKPIDDMIIGNYKTIDKDDKILEEHIDYSEEKNFSDKEDIFKLCIKDPKPSTKVYKAKIIKENNLKFDDVKIGQDLNFFVKYLMFAKNIKVIKEFMYSYRILDGSISRTYTFKILNIIETFEYIKNFYYKSNHIEEYNNYIIYAEMLHYYYQFCKLRFFDKKSDRDYIANEFNKKTSIMLKNRKKCFDKGTLEKLNKFYFRLKFRKFFTSEINRRLYFILKGIKL